VPTTGDQIVAYALQQLGKPYVWGAEGPNGYDCSGLVYAAYKAAGVPATRTTASNLGRQGREVSLQEARPGDVVFYEEGAVDHVGIYAGGGRMVDAPTQGKPVELVGVGNPTSIRRMPGVTPGEVTVPGGLSGANGPGRGGGPLDKIGDVLNPLGALGDAIGSTFGSWQSDLFGLVLKGTAAVCVVALVVVGARETIKEN
jgi:hypothetical protein